jgi:hypothetical protein
MQILAINETAIRHPTHDESFVKTHFYYKNMKRIETTDHYFVCFLEDNPSLVCPVYTAPHTAANSSPATNKIQTPASNAWAHC